MQTGPNTVATLTSQGSAVTVGGNSSLVFSKSFVNVLCGTAMIATSHGMAARVSNLLVQPARGAQTRFQIIQNEGQLQIIAREGALAIDNGAVTTSLQPGRMLTAHATCMAAPYADDRAGSSSSGDQAQNPQDNSQGNSNKKKGAAGPPGPSTAGGVNYTPLIVGGLVVAAGGALLVCATTDCWSSSSPPPASNMTPTPGLSPR